MKKLNVEIVIYLTTFTLAIVIGVILQIKGQDTLALLACMVSSFFIGMFVRTAIAIERLRSKVHSMSKDDYFERESSNGKYPRWIEEMYQ